MSSPRAMRFTRRVRLVAFLVVIAGAWFSASVALAQKPSPGPSGVEAPVQAGATAAQPISLEDVPDSAETTHAELDAIVPKDAPSQMIERIGSELDAGNLQPARVAKEGWMKSLQLRVRGSWLHDTSAAHDGTQVRVILRYDLPVI